MENFVLSNENVNLTIGTNELPKLIAIIAAKKGIGMSFCIKIDDLPLIVNEIEQESFLKFLNYLKTSYLKPTHAFFLGKISNFQLELLGNWYPQLSNNVSESLNAVLQNCYKRGFINRSALAEGLHSFYSKRRDK